MAQCEWTEEDVELAREYRNLLVEIKELLEPMSFDEDDVKTAREYLADLKEINELTNAE